MRKLMCFFGFHQWVHMGMHGCEFSSNAAVSNYMCNECCLWKRYWFGEPEHFKESINKKASGLYGEKE